MIFTRTDVLAYVIIVIIIVAVYVIRASETEKKETETGYHTDRNIERMQDKYQEIIDINVKLLEEIRQLRFENSYLSRQAHCSDSDLMNNSEFQQNLKDLIILSHPDKHGGHERAKRITQWLLQFRQRNPDNEDHHVRESKVYRS